MKSIKAIIGTKMLPILEQRSLRCLKTMRSSELRNLGKSYHVAASYHHFLETSSQPRRQLHFYHISRGSIDPRKGPLPRAENRSALATAPTSMSNLPSAGLLARAFHRVSAAGPTAIKAKPAQHMRYLSTSQSLSKWDGRQAEENTTRETDTNNIQQDAVREGKDDRAASDGSDGAHKSGATSEKDITGQNEKAKKEHPEAPRPVIGMNDERGGKGAN